jgi:hypothetical protein
MMMGFYFFSPVFKRLVDNAAASMYLCIYESVLSRTWYIRVHFFQDAASSFSPNLTKQSPSSQTDTTRTNPTLLWDRFRETHKMDGAEELKVLSHRRQVIKISDDTNVAGVNNRGKKRARTGTTTEDGLGGGGASSGGASSSSSGPQSFIRLGPKPTVDAVRDGIFKLFNLEDPPGSGVKRSHWTLKEVCVLWYIVLFNTGIQCIAI